MCDRNQGPISVSVLEPKFFFTKTKKFQKISKNFKKIQKISGRELPFIWRTNLPALKAFLATASQGLFGKVSNLKRQSLTETTVMVDNQPLEVCSILVVGTGIPRLVRFFGVPKTRGLI